MLTHIKRLVAAAVLVIIVVPAWSREEKTASAKGPQIEGTYQVISLERSGKPVPADQYRGDTVQITKDTITTRDKDKKEVLVVNYKIDPSTKPCKITTVSTFPIRDMKAAGLIECDGDTVRLVCNMAEGPVPTTFKAGVDQQMIVLKRMEKK